MSVARIIILIGIEPTKYDKIVFRNTYAYVLLIRRKPTPCVEPGDPDALIFRMRSLAEMPAGGYDQGKEKEEGDSPMRTQKG